MGFEGANVLFDTWVHPLMMGLEEHLLGMFREDFEFHDGAAPSHLGHSRSAPAAPSTSQAQPEVPVARPAGVITEPAANDVSVWTKDAEEELGKIPFFVRGKARRNTERYAQEKGVVNITVETLYDAKAYFSR
jgi:light-independent protochlorophyllide reductase subunit B